MATTTTAKKTISTPKAAKTVAAKTRARAKAPAVKTKTSVSTKTATLKQVASQSRRKVSTVVHMTRDASFKLIDTQRAIWLAGLGYPKTSKTKK